LSTTKIPATKKARDRNPTLAMRNPADLPPELFTLVLDDVLAEESTVTQACHLLLIDHKWQRILLPRIYTKWTYDGAQHSFHSLWKFWLTVNRNPDISGSVETLVIGNWGFNEYETLGHDFDYTLETSDLDLMRAKIYTIGLQDHEETILKDLARGDRRPIMALLLTCFPNVTAIDAHVPRSDPILGSVLRRILAQRKRAASAAKRTTSTDGALIPLTRLTSIRLWCEVYFETDLDLNGAYVDRARLRLDDVWPLLFLPGLETLGLYEVDFQGMLGILRAQGHGHGHGTIQDLTVACASHSEAALEDFQAFMAAMRRLQRFSFSFDDMYCGFADVDPPLVISNSDLWPILKRHQQSLQVLDIYRHGDRRSYDRQIGHTNELAGFRQLWHLSLQVDTLLGGNTESPQPPTLLQDSLPAGLQTFTFYQGEGLKMIHDLEAQIANLVSSKKFPSLTRITLEDMHHSNFARAMSASQPLQHILHTAGTSISFASSNPHQDPLGANYKLVAGGRNPTLSLESYKLRLSGQQRYKMVMDQLNPMEEDTDPEPSTAGDMDFGPHERYCLPFTDHRGSTAYMVFNAYAKCPLPKLYLFAVYLTHRDINPHHPDIHDSLKAFYEAATSTDGDNLAVPDIWRLDFYFVPGATDTQWVKHFHSELAVRGTFNTTIQRYREYRRADPPREPPSHPGTLPGIVDWYDDHLTAGQMLFICEDIPSPAAHGSSDSGWVMWQVWFGSKATKKPWEMEEWEREYFGLSGYGNGPPEGWVDENAGDENASDEGTGKGHGDEGGERQPTSAPRIVKSRCTMTRENPLWDGEDVITFGAIMSANRPMAHEKVGDFWTNAKAWGWKNW
jgi:hypothetical protein